MVRGRDTNLKVFCVYKTFIRYIETKGASGQLSRYNEELRAGRFGDLILVGTKFSAPVQTDPGDHRDSVTMNTGSFPRVRRSGHRVNNPHPPSAEVKGKQSYTGTFSLYLHGRLQVEIYLYMYITVVSNGGLLA